MESVARFVLVHRRAFVAVLAGLATWSAITAITHAPDTREVLVAARDLDSGSTVERSDLRTRRLPEAAVPDGLAAVADLTGRTLSGAMRTGEVFTDRRVVDPRNLGDDRVMAVVEVSAASGALLRPGDAVDLIAVGDDNVTRTVAETVPIVTLRTDTDRDAAVMGVAVGTKVATEVARAAMTSRLAAVVVARPGQD